MSDRDKFLELFAQSLAQNPGMALDPNNAVIQQLGWQPSADEHRRAFIIENCAPYEWSIKDMEDLFQWLKGKTSAPPSKSSLRPVD